MTSIINVIHVIRYYGFYIFFFRKKYLIIIFIIYPFLFLIYNIITLVLIAKITSPLLWDSFEVGTSLSSLRVVRQYDFVV